MTSETNIKIGNCQFCLKKKATWNYRYSGIITFWNVLLCEDCMRNVNKAGPSAAKKMIG